MMIKTIFVILSLANCCFFSGADYISWKGICNKYPPPKKGEPVLCTMEYDPICDSKGHTHGNMCLFCAERRYTKGTLTIRYKGECKEDIICSKYPPPKKDETVLCTMELYPICGSDGRTHGNKCLFCAGRWSSGGTLLIRYEGQCKEEALCSKYPLPKKGEPIGCTEEYDPICGSDGGKYNNRCYFCNAWRISGGTLTIHHEGECRPKGHYKKS